MSVAGGQYQAQFRRYGITTFETPRKVLMSWSDLQFRNRYYLQMITMICHKCRPDILDDDITIQPSKCLVVIWLGYLYSYLSEL